MRGLIAGLGTVVAVLAVAGWWGLGALGLDGWVRVLCSLLIVAAAAWVAPSGFGAITGLADAFRGVSRRMPDAEAVECLKRLTIRDVRLRADEFEHSQTIPGSERLAVPAQAWRDLEREMRAAGAWQVADLGEKATHRWAGRLAMTRDDRPFDPLHHGPEEPTPEIETVADVPSPRTPAGLKVRGTPTARVRKPPPRR